MHRIVAFIIVLTFVCRPAAADFTTLCLPATANTNITYSIPSNVVAQVTSYWMQTGSSITANIHGVSIFMATPSSNPVFTGPASITLTNSGNQACYITIQTFPTSAAQVPSTSVVIPNDTNGPVTIILESSTDLVNWTAALPGTYGTTASNRFFRVRASR